MDDLAHDTELIQTLALGFGLALLFGLAAVRLKLPPLVGYLLAGVVIGPFTPGVVADGGIAGQLSEIGVILLMFGVGMHFSIGDLLSVRKISLPGAIVQIGVATSLCVGLALLWGWSWGSGLVFGLSLSVASTVVLLRALESKGLVTSVDGKIAVGWLIVEDLVMVFALVLLPALAVTLGGSVPGSQSDTNVAVAVATTLLKVTLFGVVMYLGGLRLIPWLLGRVASAASRELFTLALLAIALGIAVGAASLFDVSFALAAFVAGMVISKSDLSHKASADSIPFQDAFAVLFFVAVGMLFDPKALIEHPLQVVAVFLVIVFGKSLAALLIVLVFRYPIKTGLHVAAGLAQIGEFSFILISLGLTYDLVPPEAESLVLAGALLSITLNPMIFATIGPIDAWLQRHPRLVAIFERSNVTDPLAKLPTKQTTLKDHVILIGYGDVGEPVARMLTDNNVPFVVIDQNRELILDLNSKGIPAICGDATRTGLLEHAHLHDARLLIVSVGNALDARLIIEHAHHVNREIEAIVRTHSEQEGKELQRLGTSRTVIAEREMARAVMEHTLQTFDMQAPESLK